MNNEKTVSVKDIEALLVCLPGIQKARVVINDWGAIEEIHILTGLSRNPKQIVRDIQSALKAQWDITVDRRKVSVAQVRVGMPEPLGRLRFVGIEVKSDARTGKSDLCVSLERPYDGQVVTYVGKVQSDSSEHSTLLGVAKATCLAANTALEPPHAFYVDDVAVHEVGSRRIVDVLVDLLSPRKNQEQMVGSAIVKRDAREACVRATLDAMNRRMEAIPQRGSVIRDSEAEPGSATEADGDDEPEPADPEPLDPANPGLFADKPGGGGPKIRAGVKTKQS